MLENAKKMYALFFTCAHYNDKNNKERLSPEAAKYIGTVVSPSVYNMLTRHAGVIDDDDHVDQRAWRFNTYNCKRARGLLVLTS